MRHNDSELLSGGGDGTLRRWDVTSGKLGREMGVVTVSGSRLHSSEHPLLLFRSSSIASLCGFIRLARKLSSSSSLCVLLLPIEGL